MTTEPSTDSLEPLIAQARAGSNSAIGKLMEQCRAHLLLVAERTFDRKLRSKVGPSDLVQETMQDAKRDIARFQGSSEAELLAWLRALLRHNVLNTVRRYRETDKRNVDRETPLEDWGSSEGPAARVVSQTPSPGAKAAVREEIERIQSAIGRLPKDHQVVLRARLLEDRLFAEVAAAIGGTEGAARALFFRAMTRLRKELDEANESGNQRFQG